MVPGITLIVVRDDDFLEENRWNLVLHVGIGSDAVWLGRR